MSWEQSPYNSQRGQSLVEILIAITFVGLIFTAVTGLVSVYQRSSRGARDLSFAQILVQDMITAVRGIAAAGWHSFAINNAGTIFIP